MTVLTFFLILCIHLSENILLSTHLLTAPGYRDHKLVGGNVTAMIYYSHGVATALTCSLACGHHTRCAAINFCTATSRSSICELLDGNICDSANGTWVLQSWSGCTAWDLTQDAFACSLTSPRNCESILPICKPGGGPLCNTCTRTCHDYYIRYNNYSNLQSFFSPDVWPEGILRSKVRAQCMDKFLMYIAKREVLTATGLEVTSYGYQLSFEIASNLFQRGLYPKLRFYFHARPVASSSEYFINSFESDGTLSVTYHPNVSNIDIFGSNGSSMAFINDSNVNPVCGPFWLVPGGNLTCPGGEKVRYWGGILYNTATATTVDSGFRSPKFSINTFISKADITLSCCRYLTM